jgi:hypothetical protein
VREKGSEERERKNVCVRKCVQREIKQWDGVCLRDRERESENLTKYKFCNRLIRIRSLDEMVLKRYKG